MSWSAPEAWVIVGLILFGLEAFHPAMILLFFGFGALLTAIIAWIFKLGLDWQLVFFSLASVASLAGLRGSLKKVFHGRSSASGEKLTRLNSLIGESATVFEAIAPGVTGRIKLRGSFYSAISDGSLAAGESVTVIEDPHGDHSLLKVVPILGINKEK